MAKRTLRVIDKHCDDHAWPTGVAVYHFSESMYGWLGVLVKPTFLRIDYDNRGVDDKSLLYED